MPIRLLMIYAQADDHNTFMVSRESPRSRPRHKISNFIAILFIIGTKFTLLRPHCWVKFRWIMPSVALMLAYSFNYKHFFVKFRFASHEIAIWSRGKIKLIENDVILKRASYLIWEQDCSVSAHQSMSLILACNKRAVAWSRFGSQTTLGASGFGIHQELPIQKIKHCFPISLHSSCPC